MEKITILLVDDHRLIRDIWSTILSGEKRFKVIGETGDGQEAIKMAGTKRPQIVLMDVNMSPVDGFEATIGITKVSSTSKIIGVTMHNIPAYAKKIMKLGAMGYITKNSSKDELITAIVEVSKGNKYICPEIKNALANEQLTGEEQEVSLENLSSRETDIVELIKKGCSSRVIAIQLGIAVKTVETHRYNILRKLKLKNTASLVNFINTSGM
jgi:DNA-binding NarL/FixJ family response regulator